MVREVARTRGKSTVEALLDSAERLFAERGIDGVSLREIGKEVGSRNTAVAHYHFGGKQELVNALIARRAPEIIARRAALLAAARRGVGSGTVPVADLVRVLVEPLADQLELGGSFLSFLARITTDSPSTVDLASLEDDPMRSYRHVSRALAAALPELDRRRFRIRLDLVVQLCLAALSNRERAERSGTAPVSTRTAFLDELYAACGGILRTPSGALQGQGE